MQASDVLCLSSAFFVRLQQLHSIVFKRKLEKIRFQSFLMNRHQQLLGLGMLGVKRSIQIVHEDSAPKLFLMKEWMGSGHQDTPQDCLGSQKVTNSSCICDRGVSKERGERLSFRIFRYFLPQTALEHGDHWSWSDSHGATFNSKLRRVSKEDREKAKVFTGGAGMSEKAKEVSKSLALFVAAGLCEIGGGWLVWKWRKDDWHWGYFILGSAILVLYGIIPTLQDQGFGRVYAAYGGFFILLSFAWAWAFDGERPDRWDLIGSAIALAGVCLIMFMPRKHHLSSPVVTPSPSPIPIP